MVREGKTRATPPAHKQPILWRSAAGSAINNNGLEIYGSSLAAGIGSPGLWRSSALSRLPWIPVWFWPLRRALETVAVLVPGFAGRLGTRAIVPCPGCTLTKHCRAPRLQLCGAANAALAQALLQFSARRGTRAVL